ncbi:hypothetical protein FACS189429_1900 [Bacteroidia bacterium]|nr:hypothetical protein FACS189429_1900 [Bacteroidia bacterium]
MKEIFLIFFVILFFISCVQKTNLKQNNFKQTDINAVVGNSTVLMNNNNKYLSEFRRLKNFIYQKEKDSVSQYFLFPLNDNDIFWYLSLAGRNDTLYDEKSSTVFSVKDF